MYESIVFNADLEFADNDLDVTVGIVYKVITQVGEIIYVYDNKEILFGIDTTSNVENGFTLFEII